MKAIFLLALLFAAVYAKSVAVSVGAGNGFQFVPSSVRIAVGDTVDWTWASSGHNVVSGDKSACTSDGKFTSGAPSLTGATYSLLFNSTGTFTYFCNPHCLSKSMTGTVVVGSGSFASAVVPIFFFTVAAIVAVLL